MDVLIVAECNVNSLNSFKLVTLVRVLIVAECNVNFKLSIIKFNTFLVLIVAECNVNKNKIFKGKKEYSF